MNNYKPPRLNKIVFNFSTSGYESPDFSNLEFTFNLRNSTISTTDLKASVEILQLYHDNTYSYIKECKTVIVGYGSSGIQTLKLPCLYGGIRDLFGTIIGQYPYTDLAAYVKVGIPIKDLFAYMTFALRSQKDFFTWFRPSRRRYKDLGSYMKFIKGTEIPFDLRAFIKDVQPIQLQALVNVIELRNLNSFIDGVYFKSQADLSTYFYTFFKRQHFYLHAHLTGWAIKDLQARISSFWLFDLKAKIIAGYFGVFKNLRASLYSVTPVDLLSYLYGYAKLDLRGDVRTGYGPYDLQAYLSHCIWPINLKAYIDGFTDLGVTCDLRAYISAFKSYDLKAFIFATGYTFLRAYIDAVGKYKDLNATIYPRIINIKQVLLVPLLEHKDLYATIGYNCRKSGYLNLYINMHVNFKKDLVASIIGWKEGSADYLKDLGAYINTGTFYTQDTYTIKGFNTSQPSSYIEVKNLRKLTRYRTVDFCFVLGNFNAKDLISYIVAVPHNKTLNAYIKGTAMANFTTVPDWVDPSTREVVINLQRFEERWYRFVDIMFNTNSEESFYYFYSEGLNKVFKVDKNRTWSINVIGYSATDNIYKRKKINKKLLFNVKNYATFDNALRDLIDRVTLFRESTLKANINCLVKPNVTLKAYLKAHIVHNWIKNLSAALKIVLQGHSLLYGSVQPILKKDQFNLTTTIIGKGYEAPKATEADFKFEEVGYSAPEDYANIEWTYKQAEEFWKK
jgi:hypothetical protein